MERENVLARDINRIAVLRLIRDQASISRMKLAEVTGLSRSAITHIVRELMRENLVREGPELKSGIAGRNPIELSLVSNAKYAIGVQIGDSGVMVLLANWMGEIKYQRKIGALDDADILQCVKQVMVYIEEAASQVPQKDILGIGLGVPGLVDSRTGQLLLVPNLHGNYESIGKYIESHMQLPVLIDNDVNLMAMGELHFGKARGYRNIVCISVTQGIGSGIIINQQIYRGSRGLAGEIGHAIVDINGERCGCGNRGCLETVAGGRALLKQCRDVITEEISGDHASGRNAFEAIRAKIDGGDPVCGAALRNVGYHLGIGIANVIHNYNPEICILTGLVVEVFPEVLEIAAAAAQEYLLSSAKDTIITPSALGENVGAIGAIASVVDGVFGHNPAGRLAEANASARNCGFN